MKKGKMIFLMILTIIICITIPIFLNKSVIQRKLEIAKQEEIKENIKMPNVTGLTFEEAKKTLKDVGIETHIREVQDETKTFFIDDGVTSKICLYCKKRYG